VRRLLLALAFAASFVVGAWGFSDAAPGDLLRTNNSGGNQTLVPKIDGTPCWRVGNQTFRPDGVAFSACSATTSSSTTTMAPTTSTSPASTTTAAASTSTSSPPTSSTTSTTTPPSGAQFVETFDGNTGLDRFDAGVWHRDPYLVETSEWNGDHDLNCGSPVTQRVVHRGSATVGGTQFPAGEYFYLCANHLMTAVGDTSGYSIAWFSPNQVFDSVSEVSFDVTLTNLGDRKWWKVGVVSDSLYQTTWNGSCCGPAQGFLFADNGVAGLPGLEGSGRLIGTWGENYPGYFGVGDGHAPLLGGAQVNPSPNDKMTRHPVVLHDNNDGTVTFTVAGVSVTQEGAFPTCPCRIVFYDHSYTPNKSTYPRVVDPYTWHWDSIVVR
jgi:hypothetical protein